MFWWVAVCSDLCGVCLVVDVFFLGRVCFGNGFFGGICFFYVPIQF
jgi:hypothetical protein